MSDVFSITAAELCKDLRLKCVYEAGGLDNLEITSRDVNRCGQQLMGYLDYFDSDRIQIIGLVEYTYLQGLVSDERFERINNVFKLGFPVFIITRGLEIFPELLKAERKTEFHCLLRMIQHHHLWRRLLHILTNSLHRV